MKTKLEEFLRQLAENHDKNIIDIKDYINKRIIEIALQSIKDGQDYTSNDGINNDPEK